MNSYIILTLEDKAHSYFTTRPEPCSLSSWYTGLILDNTKMVVELIAPIAMDEGLRFAIREGGRTVGAGVVASIVE